MRAYPTTTVQDEYDEARTGLETLIEQLRSPQAATMRHDEIERTIAEGTREVARRMLQAHVDERTRAERERPRASVDGSDGVERTHRREAQRGLLSVFGPVTITRMSYGARAARSLMPADAELNLPAELYSHELRRHAAIEAARGSFDGAVEAIERATATTVPKRQVEQIVTRAASDFDAFYMRAQGAPPSPAHLLVLSFDGKGIVMRREHLREQTRRNAERAERKLRGRLSKGEKAHRKRMATVAAVYDVLAMQRGPRDVLADLRPVRDVAKPRPRAVNKRVWAHIDRSVDDVAREVFDEAERRDPEHARRWVVLVDGNKAQIAAARTEAARRGVRISLVLDLIHVLEYLWSAAWCLFSEGDRAAEQWVHERAFTILQGRSSDVAAGMRRSATLRGLSTRKRTGIDECADYLLGHSTMLAYDDYLEAGLPIATGVIEGACRHLIKDRMDITGARWSVQGAEAVLRLRSLRSSGDFDDYWAFHLASEHLLNHSSRYAVAA
jgi:hypothetical protein